MEGCQTFDHGVDADLVNADGLDGGVLDDDVLDDEVLDDGDLDLTMITFIGDHLPTRTGQWWWDPQGLSPRRDRRWLDPASYVSSSYSGFFRHYTFTFLLTRFNFHFILPFHFHMPHMCLPFKMISLSFTYILTFTFDPHVLILLM